jgi:DNA-binding MarR family transcriptional regulator
MPQKTQAPAKTLVSDARAAIRDCAGINARAAARRITRFMEARLQATGLGFAQFSLMAQIAAASDDTIGALAERSGLDQSTLSRTLRTLERAGLVEITIVEQDLRRRAVWLTERGARRLEAAMPVWRHANEALAQVIDADAVRHLAASTAVLATPPEAGGRSGD